MTPPPRGRDGTVYTDPYIRIRISELHAATRRVGSIGSMECGSRGAPGRPLGGGPERHDHSREEEEGRGKRKKEEEDDDAD